MYPDPAFLLTAGLDAGRVATLLSRLWALGRSGWGGTRGPGLTFIHEVPRIQEQPMAVLMAGAQGERRGDLALQVGQGGVGFQGASVLQRPSPSLGATAPSSVTLPLLWFCFSHGSKQHICFSV